MKKLITLLFILVITAFFQNSCTTPNRKGDDKYQVMDDIIKRGSIKCSYLVYSPYFIKDPKTGEFSGIFYEIMEKIGEKAQLKIEWVEEVGYENMYAGLDNHRYDIFAGGLWPDITRAKVGVFTIPVFYSVVKAWCRSDDNRFDNNLDAINNIPGIKIATIDGAMEDIIAKNDFPNVERLSLPQLSPFTMNYQNIISKKADVTFAEPALAYEFLSKNPGSIKESSPNEPLRIFGNSLVIGKDQYQLQNFLNVALQELLYCRDIDKILKKYESHKNIFPRIALPYTMEQEFIIPNYSNTN